MPANIGNGGAKRRNITLMSQESGTVLQKEGSAERDAMYDPNGSWQRKLTSTMGSKEQTPRTYKNSPSKGGGATITITKQNFKLTPSKAIPKEDEELVKRYNQAPLFPQEYINSNV